VKKIILIGFSIIFTLLGALHFLIEEYPLMGTSKVWRHGGGEPQNEIQSVLNSLESGYEGVEVNIFFDKGNYFLRKDKKDLSTSNEELEELLVKLIDTNSQIWLDLKPIEIGDLLDAGDQMKVIFKKHKLISRSFVETKSLLTAALLKIKGIPVILWFEEKPGSIKNTIYETLFVLVKGFFKIDRISYDLGNSKVQFLKNYNSKRAIFTVNDDQLGILNCDKMVKIILTDLSFEEQKEKLIDCSVLQK
jgi:hypothetical protein